MADNKIYYVDVARLIWVLGCAVGAVYCIKKSNDFYKLALTEEEQESMKKQTVLHKMKVRLGFDD